MMSWSEAVQPVTAYWTPPTLPSVSGRILPRRTLRAWSETGPDPLPASGTCTSSARPWAIAVTVTGGRIGPQLLLPARTPPPPRGRAHPARPPPLTPPLARAGHVGERPGSLSTVL